MSLTINLVGGKPVLQVGNNKKELSKEAVLEMLQLMLSHVAGNRDYTNVVSVTKLVKIIELECEPDESDGETEEAESKPETTAVSQKEEEPAAKRPASRAPRRPVAKKDDE